MAWLPHSFLVGSSPLSLYSRLSGAWVRVFFPEGTLMTDREMLDHFSDVLISDPRLLSLQERELLSNLLQLAHRFNGDDNVAETIARAVGETVAGRMHEALGSSILQRIAAERTASTSNTAQFPPRPPSPGPPSPGVGLNLTEAGTQSLPPRPPTPGRRPPGLGFRSPERGYTPS